MKQSAAALARRVFRIVVRPANEWDVIAREPATVGSLLLAYVLPLCLIPAAATAIGIAFFGADWNPQHGYSLPRSHALAIGAANYGLMVASILLLALIFRWLATSPGRARNPYVECLKVAAYGATPVLLAGAFLVLPVMGMVVVVAALHTLFLYNAGVTKVLGVRESESMMLLGISLVALFAASMAIGAVLSALGLV